MTPYTFDLGKKTLNVTGTGAWKNITVVDNSTGEVLAEKKFYKAEFDSVMNNEEFKNYIDLAMESLMVKRMKNDAEMEIDAESYEEVRSIAMNMEDEIILPE